MTISVQIFSFFDKRGALMDIQDRKICKMAQIRR